MRWTDGRGYVAPTQGNVNRSVQKNLEEIDRRLMRQQKPTEPTGGAMQGFTRARPGSASWSPSGVQMTGWTFDSALDTSPAPKPSLIADADPHFFGVVDEGWYVTHVRAQVTLGSGSPVAGLVQANTGFASVEGSSYYGEMWALQSPFDLRYRADFWVGPFWLPAGAVPLSVEMHFPGTVSGGSVTSAFVDVWRVG